MTRDRLITVRKTTPGRLPYDSAPALAAKLPEDPPGLCFYHLADDVADRYLDLVDDLEEEIGELEDHVEQWEPEQIGRRIRQLRHQILHVRRTLAPVRDAIRAAADGRIDLSGTEIFSRRIELELAGVHDRLLRAADGLELAHDLLAGARDFFQAKVAQDQNDVIKRLTAIASLLLVPTFIVGLYGQNFADTPEYQWGVWGYVWSWGVIVGVTVLQLWYFRRRGWL
jgi:magnesium transporter